MRRLIQLQLLILLLLVTITNVACTGAQDNIGKDKSLLWRISGNGLQKPSYLFGTIDFICLSNYVWTSKMEDCLQSCDKVALPLNYRDANMKASATAALMNKDGKTLRDYFTPDQYAVVEPYIKNVLHTDVSRLQQFQLVVLRPFIVKYLLGCTDVVSSDLRITAAAVAYHKPVVPMETIEEEMAEIDSIHYNEKMVKILLEMAGGSKLESTFRTNTENAYIQQDIAQVYELQKDVPLFSPSEIHFMLNESSKRLESRMPAEMQQASVFFALNTTYFWGDDGIINLLRKAGYTVEPVK